jgi:cobalt-zinc-cadmium resistance protein CzcA
MNGIIVIGYFNTLIDGGVVRSAALSRACAVKMRPVAMTCIVAGVGLLPAAVSGGIGSQVQKPLAMVVVGGSFLAPLLILLVLPVLIDLLSRRKAPVGAPQLAPAE